jgi:hypothetical protein
MCGHTPVSGTAIAHFVRGFTSLSQNLAKNPELLASFFHVAIGMDVRDEMNYAKYGRI